MQQPIEEENPQQQNSEMGKSSGVALERIDSTVEIEDVQQEVPIGNAKRLWRKAATIPILKHFVLFLQTYGTLFLFNHAYRSLFFMNLISGIGNFFSEIAIVSLIEGAAHNSTITNSTLSNSTNLMNRTSFDFGFHSTSFLTKLLMTRSDAIYKITQEYDVPSVESEASGSAVSGVFISILLPAVVLMPITGIVADMFDRRKILLISDIFRGFIVLLFLVAYFVGVQELQWLIYLIIVLQSSCGSFFEPSREALVPLVVKQEDLPIANALDSLCWLAVSFFGSSVGGIVVSLLGVVVNFAFDSFSFFLSGFFCVLLFKYKHLGISGIEERRRQELKAEIEKKSVELNVSTDSQQEVIGEMVVHSSEANLEEDDEKVEKKKQKKEEKKNILEEDQTPAVIVPNSKYQNFCLLFFKAVKDHLLELIRGMVFFSKNPLIFTSTFVKGSGAFFWFSCELILIRLSYGLFAGENKNMGGLYFGVAKCFSGIGSGLAPVILERLLPKKYSTRTLRGILTAASFGYPICFTIYYFSILLATDPSTRDLGFAGVCLSSLILGTSGGTLWSFSITHLQMVCPNDYLGRAFAFDIGFFLNLAGICAMLLYGSILDDIFKFEPAHMALFELGSSCVLCLMFCIWFFVFRKNVITREAHLAANSNSIVDQQETETNNP